MGNFNTQHLRISSLRTKIRKKKQDKEKLIRREYKKREQLYKIKREIQPVPLEKPYQKGFVRFFVLREDLAKTKMADFFNHLLDKINTYQYSPNRKFQKKKRKRGKKIDVERPQKLRRFSEYEFFNCKKINLNDKERSYFIKVEDYCHHRKQFVAYYEFRDAWRFSLKVKPYMITHYKPLDIDLEAKIDELSDFLDQHKVRGILQKKFFCHKNYWIQYKDPYNENYIKDFLKHHHFKRFKMSATDIQNLFLDELF